MRSKAFLDLSGRLRRVDRLPPLALLEFHDWIEVALQVVVDRQATPSLLYASDDLFRQVCDRALLLHRIEPTWIDCDTVARFLFGEEGRLGELVELNREEPRPDRMEEPPVAVEEWVCSLIASLAQFEGDLLRAIQIAKTVPSDLLQGILRASRRQTEEDLPIDSPEYQEVLKDLDESLGLI